MPLPNTSDPPAEPAPFSRLYWLVMRARMDEVHPSSFRSLEGTITFYARTADGERVPLGSLLFDRERGARDCGPIMFANCEVELDEARVPSFFQDEEPEPSMLVLGDEDLFLDFLEVLDRAPQPTSSFDLHLREIKGRR